MIETSEEYQASLRVERTVRIDAPIQVAYKALLEQLGSEATMPDGTLMPMSLEAYPGGRWFRDLGNQVGHWWGQVQVIKPPSLIEISGPLFMSYPALSHLQYRLVEEGDITTLHFLHRAVGELDVKHCETASGGWEHQLEQIKRRAERTSQSCGTP